MRVSDYIAEFIYQHGTKHVFLLSGGGMMYLTDGLACNKKIKTFCVHHEQTSSMAMEAYARVTGNMGVGYFTTGPGTTNALTGLAGAWLDSVPCLFISGQVKRRNSVYKTNMPAVRQIGVQEINILPIIKSVTKYSAFVEKPEDIRYQLEKAWHFAYQGRPGPVWLDIPLDVQGANIQPKKLKGFIPPIKKEKITESDIKKVIGYLKAAKRPVVLAGRGVRLSGAIEELLSFVEKHKIPVVTTYLGIDNIGYNHPCYCGVLGIKGTRAGNLAIQNSDMLMILGSSLPVAEVGYEYNQFARKAKIVVVDIELSSHKRKTIKIDVLIKADIKEFLNKLSRQLKGGASSFDKNWLKTCILWKKKYPACLPEYGKLKNKINLYYFIDKLSDKLKNNDIVVTDAGSVFYAGSQGMKIKKGMRYIASGGLATMGYSVPAGIGISVGLNGKRIACVTGDGSFQLNIQELQTIKHYNLPVKIFIINNDGYLSIRFTQSRFFNKRFIGVDSKSGVSFPNSEKIARAYGIKFIRASKNSQLNKALDETLKYKGPVICEIVSPKDQEIIPTIASQKKPDGTMVSKPIEDMYPFLDRDEFNKNMFIKPIKE